MHNMQQNRTHYIRKNDSVQTDVLININGVLLLKVQSYISRQINTCALYLKWKYGMLRQCAKILAYNAWKSLLNTTLKCTRCGWSISAVLLNLAYYSVWEKTAVISGCCVDIHQLFLLTPLTFCIADIFSAVDVNDKTTLSRKCLLSNVQWWWLNLAVHPLFNTKNYGFHSYSVLKWLYDSYNRYYWFFMQY